MRSSRLIDYETTESGMSPNSFSERPHDAAMTLKTSPIHGSESTLDTEYSPDTESIVSVKVHKIPLDFILPFHNKEQKGCNESDSVKDDTSKAKIPNRRSCIRDPFGPERIKPQTRGRIVRNYLPSLDTEAVKQCCVDFDEVVRVKQIASTVDLVDDQSELWYQAQELEAIRKKVRLLIDKIRHGRTRGRRYCVRGLEVYFENARKQIDKFTSIQSVLEEQEYQFALGTFDETAISSAYSPHTLRSKREAAQLALDDQKDPIIYNGYL
jgi:hypothetical protein